MVMMPRPLRTELTKIATIKTRSNIFDNHHEQLFPAELGGGFHLVHNQLGLDHIADENAGEQRHNRHNHRVADEVEEGEEIHAQNLNMAPYAVAQGGWQRQQHHADKHDNAGDRTLDMEFVDDDGYHGFHQGDGRCQRGEQHQQEEQRSDDLAELAAAHAVKYLGQSLET